jgi:RNA polymerase sigma-70 factor (ECF subfamily)
MKADSRWIKHLDGKDLSDGTGSLERNILIKRAKIGDKEAFVTLILLYEYIIRSIVRSFIRNITGYEEDELVNEIITRAYQIIPDFEGKENEFKSWLRRTTWGICNNIRKKQTREREVKEVLQHTSQRASQKPDKVYSEGEIKNCVQKAIALLPESHREIVILKDIEGLRYEEIAEMLSIPRGTVQSRSDRARKMLKKLFEELHCVEML